MGSRFEHDNAIMGSSGYVTANQQNNVLRIAVAASNPTLPLQLIDTDLMQSQNVRSDFALVPLSDLSVGVL